MISNNIVKKFLSNIWLFENVLWKYSNLVAINQKKEKIKKILFEVYGYKDIYDIVPQELDKEGMDKFLRTLFTYHENPQALELEKLK